MAVAPVSSRGVDWTLANIKSHTNNCFNKTSYVLITLDLDSQNTVTYAIFTAHDRSARLIIALSCQWMPVVVWPHFSMCVWESEREREIHTVGERDTYSGRETDSRCETETDRERKMCACVSVILSSPAAKMYWMWEPRKWDWWIWVTVSHPVWVVDLKTGLTWESGILYYYVYK